MESEKEPFYKAGLNFGCQRCSFCCGHSPGFVYLSRRDLTALCDFFKLSVKEFVEKYCRWADYYYGTKVLALQEQKNYDCILWNSGCTAYEARPIQCSTYPFWSWMLEDRKTSHYIHSLGLVFFCLSMEIRADTIISLAMFK